MPKLRRSQRDEPGSRSCLHLLFSSSRAVATQEERKLLLLLTTCIDWKGKYVKKDLDLQHLLRILRHSTLWILFHALTIFGLLRAACKNALTPCGSLVPRWDSPISPVASVDALSLEPILLRPKSSCKGVEESIAVIR